MSNQREHNNHSRPAPQHHQRPHNNGPRRNQNLSLRERFRASVLYAISNMETVPEPTEKDNRSTFVVFCRNNPTHLIEPGYAEQHAKECPDNKFMPGKPQKRMPIIDNTLIESKK